MLVNVVNCTICFSIQVLKELTSGRQLCHTCEKEFYKPFFSFLFNNTSSTSLSCFVSSFFLFFSNNISSLPTLPLHHHHHHYYHLHLQPQAHHLHDYGLYHNYLHRLIIIVTFIIGVHFLLIIIIIIFITNSHYHHHHNHHCHPHHHHILTVPLPPFEVFWAHVYGKPATRNELY